MLLCILYAVCYLVNHKCTMLLTFVCSIFNFFPVPNYVFLFSFVQPLCTAKISVPFQQYNCSQDQLSKKIQHCFCSMSPLLGATLAAFSVLWLQSGLVALHVCCTDVTLEFLSPSLHLCPALRLLLPGFYIFLFLCLFPCSSRGKLFWKLHISLSSICGSQVCSSLFLRITLFSSRPEPAWPPVGSYPWRRSGRLGSLAIHPRFGPGGRGAALGRGGEEVSSHCHHQLQLHWHKP